MAETTLGILVVVITFFSTFIGGLFTLKNSRLSVKYFFAFAAGALIGVSFFDIMPEVIEIVRERGVSTVTVMGIIVLAFFFFHVLDRAIVIHAMRHGHMSNGNWEAQKELLANGMVRAGGLSVHSFLDGVAIGTAFHIGFEFGVVVGLAVIFHDFSDGLNTVTVMRRAGSTSRTTFFWLMVDSLAPMTGALTTFVVVLSKEVLAILLAFFVGEFLYIGAADLLPEAHQRGTSLRVVLATILGVSLIFIATRFLSF